MSLAVVAVLSAPDRFRKKMPSRGDGARRNAMPRRLAGKGPNRLKLGTANHREVFAEAGHSVVIVGPTQSGKTTRLVLPAIENWDGPVLVSSVKDDVLRATMERRLARGPVAVIDPGKMTHYPTVSWNPVASVGSFNDARRLARDLCSASSATVPSGDEAFWLAAAARMLAPLLLAAALSDATLPELLSWISEQQLSEPLAILLAASEHDAYRVVLGSLDRDPRQSSSITTTIEVVVESLIDGGAGTGAPLVVDQLLGAKGTLYLSAPLRDQDRSRGMLTAIRNEVIDHALQRAASEGGRLRQPLLVVQDEAAQLAGLETLAQLAATGIGQGITLLTVFQDIGQVVARHGALGTSLVLNHRARVLCAGRIDPTTVQLFRDLSGEEVVETTSTTRAKGERSTHTQRECRPRLRGEQLVALRRGQAIVLYDTERPFVITLGGKPNRNAAT